jgi:hypothetical protein
MPNRVVIVQQPDGTYVQQVVNVDVNVAPPMPMPQWYPSEWVIEQQPLPPPPQGLAAVRGVFNGDQRWNPITRRYEWVQLDRPPRTGWRKTFFGR